MPHIERPAIRIVVPAAHDWQSARWGSGMFDSATRALTRIAEGRICVDHYLVFATLAGGADRLEVSSDCGHRFSGAEHTGAVSLVPPNCERRFALKNVRGRWASLAIDPTLMEQIATRTRIRQDRCRTNTTDPYLFGLLGEMHRLLTADGTLDATYCHAASTAAAHYISRRYGERGDPASARRVRLTRRQLAIIETFIDEHVSQPIRVSDLATLTGISEGHLHRSMRESLHTTPLNFINERRVRRAQRLLTTPGQRSVIDVALSVGFTSPQYFARVFRRFTGRNPADFRLEMDA